MASGGTSALGLLLRASQVPAGNDSHMMVWKCDNGECTHTHHWSLSPCPQSALGQEFHKLHKSSQSLLLWRLPRMVQYIFTALNLHSTNCPVSPEYQCKLFNFGLGLYSQVIWLQTCLVKESTIIQ